jgi:hypothetical protein
MKAETREFMIIERRRSDFGFIIEIIQRGINKLKKYRHNLIMPVFLYEELSKNGIIKPENYFIDESAFFEFSETEATISFINLFTCEDLHSKIDRYLIIKFAGSYPIKRNGIMF